MLAVLLPLLGAVQLGHWMALALDCVLFPDFKDTRVNRPFFIVGIPRSGTTHLHRVLSRDENRFTTLKLWHVLLAPAICQRRMVNLLAGLDRLAGRPLARLLQKSAAFLSRGLDDVHDIALDQPEEDFLLLLPAMSCFILIPVFPQSREISDLAFFDLKFSPEHRREVMNFYKAMLKRHLYCEGPDKTLLSKNVSFTPMLSSLLQTFPKARIAACVRDPEKTLPSQISAMEKSWVLLGNSTEYELFVKRWVELISHYYKILADSCSCSSSREMQCIDMSSLTRDLKGTVQALYQQFNMEPDQDFLQALADEESRARKFTSRHKYSLTGYGLHAEDLRPVKLLWEQIRAFSL